MSTTLKGSETNTSSETKNTKSKATTKKLSQTAKYPRHSIDKVLRIPKAILEQNAGKLCTDKESARYVGVGYAGPYQVEIASALKYGLINRPSKGKVAVSDLAKKIIRPQRPEDEISGLREAVLKAPDISDIYMHYRGEYLPDKQFFDNALIDNFKIPKDKVKEFTEIFYASLNKAKLIEDQNGKYRVIDVSHEDSESPSKSDTLKKLGKGLTVSTNDACFVMMPFASPYSNYYLKIYAPAIEKAGLKPLRADDEIFGTGKIMEQIWTGINSAKVLVAELTTRNPNVFYELGLAHALKKPVVLVSSNEEDVPFDLQHIRVIYYDVNDPFWGNKLIEKVAENILSALKNPEEAIFERAVKLKEKIKA